MSKKISKISRRNFLKTTGAAGVATVMTPVKRFAGASET